MSAGTLDPVPVHGIRLWQTVLDDKANAIALVHLDRRSRNAAVHSPRIDHTTRYELGAHVLDADVKHFHPVFEPPREIGHVRGSHCNDAWPELPRRNWERGRRGLRRWATWLLMHILSVDALRGGDAGHGREPTQKRPSARLHENSRTN
jgi:hypothetical protein